MPGVTVDASVWISTVELHEPFYRDSRAFFEAVVTRGLDISIPAIARLEVACALARRRQDSELGRRLADSMLSQGRVLELPLDTNLLAMAVVVGLRRFLRGSDALYAATAQLSGHTLVSWDGELIRRAGARAPSDWLAANR